MVTDTLNVGMFADRRTRAWTTLVLIGVTFALLFIAGALVGEEGLATNLLARRLKPSWDYLLGTDMLGRDMMTRTLLGLRTSLGVGVAAALCSALIAGTLGIVAAVGGRRADSIVSLTVDLFMSMPHLVLLVLVAFVLGGGAKAVIVAVAISHWPRLARIIRAEVLQLKEAPYIHIAGKLGATPMEIARRHMMPHLLAQFVVGAVLLVPHAILHAAALTFLGFGLTPHTPSIGMLLSESMRHLSTGYWWLAIFPGVALVCAVKLFDMAGNELRLLLSPRLSEGR
ncbi:peptide ABC transporter permease [Desulfoluna limicola]|uniref:Peptide ABC transporter permease n=1 Tax=Desulfoluna limicola TaxID=2810562 RepID=A0ABM7PIA8_9BACT|nr:ABC transporter permease [Desulfoluna limicola]BCS97015.1 peptide ABC transporter permease [Desulfoluna limicola]